MRDEIREKLAALREARFRADAVRSQLPENKTADAPSPAPAPADGRQ